MTLTMLVEFDSEHSGRIEWAPARVIYHKFHIHPSRLRQLVDDGHVRTKKMGSTPQSQNLYNCDDVRTYLNTRNR